MKTYSKTILAAILFTASFSFAAFNASEAATAMPVPQQKMQGDTTKMKKEKMKKKKMAMAKKHDMMKMDKMKDTTSKM
ncbi:hypothetical protein [Mucilaginibacter pedocola]|uniref:Pentapeptide MXKDX repeat protein n=1 Tax=Mucilaginibacter pedocola TaxID=1792845 RepID=A0A1S9P9H3_9SPHI|nr:hypothetical protein [Mucilaginibacter pedocola]OOQ57634.1 hypothetical protein BC343_12580 [Mucilaginibacter pedocola]